MKNDISRTASDLILKGLSPVEKQEADRSEADAEGLDKAGDRSEAARLAWETRRAGDPGGTLAARMPLDYIRPRIIAAVKRTPLAPVAGRHVASDEDHAAVARAHYADPKKPRWTPKDVKRADDELDRWDADRDEHGKEEGDTLSTQRMIRMANAIDDPKKALGRAYAMEDANLHHAAHIFYNRAALLHAAGKKAKSVEEPDAEDALAEEMDKADPAGVPADPGEAAKKAWQSRKRAIGHLEGIVGGAKEGMAHEHDVSEDNVRRLSGVRHHLNEAHAHAEAAGLPDHRDKIHQARQKVEALGDRIVDGKEVHPSQLHAIASDLRAMGKSLTEKAEPGVPADRAEAARRAWESRERAAPVPAGADPSEAAKKTWQSRHTALGLRTTREEGGVHTLEAKGNATEVRRKTETMMDHLMDDGFKRIGVKHPETATHEMRTETYHHPDGRKAHVSQTWIKSEQHPHYAAGGKPGQEPSHIEVVHVAPGAGKPDRAAAERAAEGGPKAVAQAAWAAREKSLGLGAAILPSWTRNKNLRVRDDTRP